MVPDGVVAVEISQRFRKAVLSEHLLSQRLLVGVGSGGQIELVALVDDAQDHTALTTVVAPVTTTLIPPVTTVAPAVVSGLLLPWLF